jgi:hypothetical protein
VARSGNLQSLRTWRFSLRVGAGLVRSANVQVLHLMPCGEGVEFVERRCLYVAAILANAMQQSVPRGAESSILPATVLTPWVATSPLQPPLQRIVHDPPSLAKLG